MKGLEHVIPGTKTSGHFFGVYNPGENGRGGSHGHMTACCYAACGKEASDNGNQGPQPGRGEGEQMLLNTGVTQVHRLVGGGLMATQCEMPNKSPGKMKLELNGPLAE